MRDLDRLKAMLAAAGVVYSIQDDGDGPELAIEAQTGRRNLGYHGFFVEFFFDSAGTLREVGVWESAGPRRPE